VIPEVYTFENVRVPKENMLGKPGEGWAIAMATLDHSRPLVCNQRCWWRTKSHGLCHRICKAKKSIWCSYCKTSSYTIYDCRYGDKKLKLQDYLLHKAAWMCDNGERNTEIASYAKAFAADSCMQITTDAVQIYGGYGYSKEYPVEKLNAGCKTYSNL
jgi:acyl-CoA dehydrogenase